MENECKWYENWRSLFNIKRCYMKNAKGERIELKPASDGKNCNRCGICCKTNHVLDQFSEEEWITIIKEMHEQGVFLLRMGSVHDSNCHYKIDLNGEPEKIAHDIVNCYNLENMGLFDAIDDGKCPFLHKIPNGFYECSIQKIKPKLCANFHCDNSRD